MIGQTISHYKILEKLGQGGMGVVYKAEDTKLDRLVALKFLPKQVSINEEEKKRFIHEAKAAAALDHPNICAIYEIDETKDGQMFIAMACYEGVTLKEKIEKGPIKLNEALDIAIQVTEGLQEAHENKIIHRDIKSANIIITDKGITKILDFGLAKLRGQTKLTKEGTTLGTVAYMSPEQTTGEEADHRSDIWSLGVLLYEMVTGQLPFKGEYEQAIMYAIMNEKSDPVTGLRTGVPVELERIINKLLAKNAEDRYQTTADLLVDLRKIKGDTKPEVKKSPPSETISIRPVWKKLIAPAFMTVVLAVIGLLIWSPWAKKKTIPIPTDKPSLAVMYFKNLTGDENLNHWKTGISYSIITDLSQSKYLKVLSTDKLFSIMRKLNLLDSTEYATEDLQAVAAQGGVSHIILGRLLKGGETFRIEYTLQDIHKEKNMGSGRVEGQGEENIFSMVDGLTKLIKADLKLSEKTITSDIDKDVGEITTSSPQAFKYYVEGKKCRSKGKFRKSIELLEKAISIDPEFAMAYRAISQSHWSLYNTAKSNLYIKKAFELADRLPARELYLIQGNFYARSEKTYDRSIHAYKKLLELYPEELETLEYLGMVYRRMEEYDKAIEIYKKRLQQKTKRGSPYMNLASLYWNKGLFDESRKVIEDYIENFNDKTVIRWYLALTYFYQGKFDLAHIEANKSLSLDPAYPRAFCLKGDIYLHQGDFVKAEKEYQKLMGHEELSIQYGGMGLLAEMNLIQGRFENSKKLHKTRIEVAEQLGDKGKIHSGYLALAYIYRKLGNIEEALKECEKVSIGAGEEDSPSFQRWVLYEKGLVYLAMKSIGKAQQAARELKEIINKGIISNHIRMYYHLRGKIEHEQEKYSQAISYFKKMVPLLHVISFWHIKLADSLGLAYYRAGDLAKAQEEYMKVTSSTPKNGFYGDIYAKAFYQLGKIYEQKGFKGKAIDSYNKFIELWKNCDPIFQPQVRDARARVKELEGNQ